MKKSLLYIPFLLGLAALACSGTLTGIISAPVYVCPTPCNRHADAAANAAWGRLFRGYPTRSFHARPHRHHRPLRPTQCVHQMRSIVATRYLPAVRSRRVFG